MISVIAAVAANRAIGLENKLLYWLPNDLKRFKALTTGHTIIMGRRTFESLPKGALPNRRNIVISRTQTSFPGCDTYSSLEEAIAQALENVKKRQEDVRKAREAARQAQHETAKIVTHRDIWLVEAKREAERLEDLEMEEFKPLPPQGTEGEL